MQKELKKGEKLLLLNLDMGNDEPYVEVVIVKEDFDMDILTKYINKYRNSERSKERSMDDDIIDYLIEKKVIIDYASYMYHNEY